MKTAVDEKIQQLMEQAAEWRLISLLMSRPQHILPEAGSQSSWETELEALSHEVLSVELRHAVRTARKGATEEEYLKWFGPSGTISPREVAYIGFEDPGLAMCGLLHFYSSFHYAPRAEDPDDHIAVESGFIGFLLLKQAYALATEQMEEADITNAAIQHFQERHISRLIRGMANRFSGNEPEYVQDVIRLLMQMIVHIPLEPVKFSPDATSETLDCALS